MAYVLICALRRIGVAETTLVDATCGAIRFKLLKIGALVRASPVAASSSPWRRLPSRPEMGRLAEAAKARASPG